jgi:hypothetical protein
MSENAERAKWFHGYFAENLGGSAEKSADKTIS